MTRHPLHGDLLRDRNESLRVGVGRESSRVIDQAVNGRGLFSPPIGTDNEPVRAHKDNAMTSQTQETTAPGGEPHGCRRFTLFDALILMGGLALTLGLGAHLLLFSTPTKGIAHD